MEPEARYTLAELADASAIALNALGVSARNGQVRERPDARTIRYYSALGLVDAPAEMTGRTARYTGRHLLQVLAVKAMQADGASLADVQGSLVGATTAELRRAIGPGLPAALAAAAADGAGGAARARAAGTSRAFWRAPPSAVPLTAPAPAPPGSGAPAPEAPGTAPGAGPRRLVAVPIAAGATLLIEDAEPGSVDAGALRAAAAPLISELAAQLTAAGPPPGPPTHPGAAP
jgi:hypothetical protein